MDKLEKQKCPICGEDKLTLLEDEMDIPYFGKTYIFSMKCDSCNYAQSDVEAEDKKDPCKIEFTVENKNDITKDLFDLANKRNVLKASIHSIQMKEDSVQFVPYTHQKKIFVVYAIYNKYSWINSPRKKTRVYKFRIVECSCGRHIEKLNENPIY